MTGEGEGKAWSEEERLSTQENHAVCSSFFACSYLDSIRCTLLSKMFFFLLTNVNQKDVKKIDDPSPSLPSFSLCIPHSHFLGHTPFFFFPQKEASYKKGKRQREKKSCIFLFFSQMALVSHITSPIYTLSRSATLPYVNLMQKEKKRMWPPPLSPSTHTLPTWVCE